MGNRLCSCGNREDATNKEEADLNTKHMKNEEEEILILAIEFLKSQQDVKEGITLTQSSITHLLYILLFDYGII